MKRAAFGVAVLLALVALAFGLSRNQPAADDGGRRARRAPGFAASPDGPSPVPEPRPEPTLSRDLFRFADEPVPAGGAPALAPPPLIEAQAALTPPPSPVRLIGFVRRGGRLCAALSVLGEVAVAAPGETVSGFLVVAVDEDAGVRVRQPDGSELTLPPAP